jgi:nicotinamide riboside kinase
VRFYKILNLKKKIIFTGAESSGKTTSALLISKQYDLQIVHEYAREYLENLGKAYVVEDLFSISETQQYNENLLFQNNDKSIVCDTDVLTIYLWAKIKYGIDSKILFENFVDNLKDKIYLLCAPDLKWDYDILRENPGDRDKIHAEYLNTLVRYNADFVIIDGQGNERNAAAITFLKQRKCIN